MAEHLARPTAAVQAPSDERSDRPLTDPSPASPASDGRTLRLPQRPGTAAALAAALAVLVHLGALANGFAYDDNVLILGDPGLRSLAGLPARLLQPSWPATFGDEIGAWRPVTTATWALTWMASGGGATAFHALGVLLHAGVTALTVLLLAALATPAVALVGGALFAVHPVHVEAVANVAGSAETLAAIFALAACVLHVRGGAGYGLGRAAAVTAAYALAVLAKEGAAVLPLLLLLLDGARRDVELRRVAAYARERGPLYALMAGALLTILVWRMDVVGAVAAASHPPGAEILREAPRVWTVFSTWPHYLRLLVFPAGLAADYAPAIVPVTFGWSASAVLGAALGLACFAAAWRLWRRTAPLAEERGSARLVALGLLWIAAALLPVANVLYLGPVLVAERTLYLASWGAAAAAAWGLVALVERLGARGVWVVAAVVVGGGVRTATRVPVWDDSEAVMAALLEDRPESGTAWLDFGRRLAREGRSRDALLAFRNAVTLLDSEYRPATEVGAHLISMGRPESARFFLLRAWRAHPEWYTAPGLLAAAELATGRPERAAPAARAAAFLQPSNPSMHHLLAQALAALGDWDGAVRARRASLEHGFADRGRSWLLLAAEHVGRADTAAALAALDSAALRTLGPEEAAAAARMRAALTDAPVAPAR